MSFWPVSDAVTREMMVDYYTGLKHGLGRGEALRQAELAMLQRKGRRASFIESGEWANLDGKRQRIDFRELDPSEILDLPTFLA